MSFTTKRSCSKGRARFPASLQATHPTYAVSSLPTDASHTLNVRPGSRGGLIPLQLGKQMLCEL